MKKIHSITEAATLLKSGAVLAHPADTCFGLTGDLMNPEVLKKIQAIKEREASKPMSIFIPHLPKAKLANIAFYGELSKFAKKICNQYLPGPITIVLPKGPKIPEWYFPETDWIGIRMVDDQNVNELLDAFGGPLITTSANLSGQAACYSTEEVEEIFKNAEVKPDGILVGDIIQKKPPSTVIKIIGDQIEVLRKGPVEIKNIDL